MVNPVGEERDVRTVWYPKGVPGQLACMVQIFLWYPTEECATFVLDFPIAGRRGQTNIYGVIFDDPTMFCG